jgi:hypothetical protein
MNGNKEHNTCHNYSHREQGNRTHQGRNHRGLRPGSKPCTASTLCTCIPVCTCVAYSTHMRAPRGEHSTDYCSNCQIPMARGHFSSTYNDTISAEDRRRYNLSVKCRALLYHRLQKQLVTQEILSSIWMRHWGITL